jgi:hypothetical protein
VFSVRYELDLTSLKRAFFIVTILQTLVKIQTLHNDESSTFTTAMNYTVKHGTRPFTIVQKPLEDHNINFVTVGAEIIWAKTVSIQLSDSLLKMTLPKESLHY